MTTATLNEVDLAKYQKEAEPWAEYLSIKNTPIYVQFLNRPEKVTAFFTGNQWGKNVNIVKHYITRWNGWHPIEEKNLRPDTKIRTYRFCSETLPTDPDGGDRNTIYPVLKRLLPKWMVKKDVTQRKPIMTLLDPQGGPDIFVEFVSYGQEVQTQAGVQRASIYIDENCSRTFFEEQLPRLLASDGDIVIGMTPALGQVTWQFEELYERAKVIIRTPRVRKRLLKRFGDDFPEVEITGQDSDICVLMAATDDNPHYDELVSEKNRKELELIKAGRHHFLKDEKDFVPTKKIDYIKGKLGIFDDETEDVRRYGIFRQVSGRIFKDFDSRIHVLEERKFFPDGIPHTWVHGRAIDYHQSTPWHTTFIALSPQNEAFVYDESVMSPNQFVTLQIARDIATRGKDYKYSFNKVDPLAATVQTNTGMCTIDDLNRIFSEYKKEGIGTGAWWSSWDSKSTRGREEVKRRLSASRLCGTPFNNRKTVNGRTECLPTIWFLSNCRVTIDSIKNWRYEEWSNRQALETKEAKETPMQKYSHICTAIECLFKEQGFKGRGDVRPISPRNTVLQYGMRQ